jgi:23S rRNA (guanosine2251-2'-O)-methyltransferase
MTADGALPVITGFHAIEGALRSGLPSPATLFSHGSPGPRARALLALAAERGVPTESRPLADLDRLCAALPESQRKHRGLVLQMGLGADGPDGAAVDAAVTVGGFLAGLGPEARALVLLLDHITDGQNLGAILRSADQFGVDLVVVPTHGAAQGEQGAVLRSSAGAAAWVPLAREANLVSVIGTQHGAGFWVYGADSTGESAPETVFAPRTALVLGSEGQGLARLIAKHCDTLVSIPTVGHIDSLNVSVAGGILLYEIRRQQPKEPSHV